jgi:hypothetical protein
MRASPKGSELMIVSICRTLCREFRRGGERLDGDARYQRLPSPGIPPCIAHFAANGFGIEGPTHRIADRGAVNGARDLGAVAMQQLIARDFSRVSSASISAFTAPSWSARSRVEWL